MRSPCLTASDHRLDYLCDGIGTSTVFEKLDAFEWIVEATGSHDALMTVISGVPPVARCC